MAAAAARQVVFAAAPLTFGRRAALEYTGISDKLFASLERSGQLTGRKLGRNGELIFWREQLDAVTARLFGDASTDIDDEFEGIGADG